MLPNELCRLHFNEGLVYCAMDWEEKIVFKKALVLLDFVGKMDKNKIKIFVDDIIQDAGGNIGLVEWNNDHAQFLIKFGNETQELVDVEQWGTIIGNRWQNPKLLKVKK
jgi:hypothetical protein